MQLLCIPSCSSSLPQHPTMLHQSHGALTSGCRVIGSLGLAVSGGLGDQLCAGYLPETVIEHGYESNTYKHTSVFTFQTEGKTHW